MHQVQGYTCRRSRRSLLCAIRDANAAATARSSGLLVVEERDVLVVHTSLTPGRLAAFEGATDADCGSDGVQSIASATPVAAVETPRGGREELCPVDRDDTPAQHPRSSRNVDARGDRGAGWEDAATLALPAAPADEHAAVSGRNAVCVRPPNAIR